MHYAQNINYATGIQGYNQNHSAPRHSQKILQLYEYS